LANVRVFSKTPRDAFELGAPALDPPDRGDYSRLKALLEAVAPELRGSGTDYAPPRLAPSSPPGGPLGRVVVERRRMPRNPHAITHVSASRISTGPANGSNAE